MDQSLSLVAPVGFGGLLFLALVVFLWRGEVVKAEGTGAEKVKFGKLEVETSRVAFLFLIAGLMVSLPILLQHFRPEPPVAPKTVVVKEAVLPEQIHLYVSGYVADPNGQPLAKAKIRVLDMNQRLLLEKESDDAGLYGFELDVKTRDQQLTVKTEKEDYFSQQFIIGPTAAVNVHAVLSRRDKPRRRQP